MWEPSLTTCIIVEISKHEECGKKNEQNQRNEGFWHTRSNDCLSFRREVMLDPSKTFSVCATVSGCCLMLWATEMTTFLNESTKSVWFISCSGFTPAIWNALFMCPATCTVWTGLSQAETKYIWLWKINEQSYPLAEDLPKRMHDLFPLAQSSVTKRKEKDNIYVCHTSA